MSHEIHNQPLAAVRIGIFDSGIGGLSVLRCLREQSPKALLHYIADSGHAPYGDRSGAFVTERSMRIAEHLVERGAQAMVVACNTATAVAIGDLRERWPALRIVGVEPGLKPALAISRLGRVGVMATGATLRSKKFRALLNAHAREHVIHLQACDGLAAAIEQCDWNGAELEALIERHSAPLRAAQVDTVVLGCTHYPLVRSQIQRALGESIQLVDTADGVVRQLLRSCAEIRVNPLEFEDWPSLRLQTTGDERLLGRVAVDWLHWRGGVETATALA